VHCDRESAFCWSRSFHSVLRARARHRCAFRYRCFRGTAKREVRGVSSKADGDDVRHSRSGAHGLMRLLTVAEVADLLRCSPRTIRREPISFVKRGRTRLYEPMEVRRYIRENTQCTFSGARAPPSTTQSSRSKVADFLDAQRLRQSEKQRQRSAGSAKMSRHGPKKRVLLPRTAPS